MVEIDKLKAENERFRKIFWLASKDEMFFSSYNGKDWDDNWHLALNCNDFFYAAADAESIPEDEHLDETLDTLIELVKRFDGYGPLAWISLKRNMDPPDWHWQHPDLNVNKERKELYEKAKEWLKERENSKNENRSKSFGIRF